MQKPMRLVQLIMLHCIMATFLCAQDNPMDLLEPESVGLSSDSLKFMNAYFHELVDDGQLAGIQTAVMRHDKLVHFDSYGYSNIEEGTSIDEKSIFRIFSMTKPIVSLALMKLYEDGQFKLEDPLYKYIPEFKEMYIYSDSLLILAQNPIRIVDLLRHTSGFSYGRGQSAALNQLYADAALNQSETNKEYVLKLSGLPLQFEPGTDWQYGVSTNICGYLIEVLSGQTLQVFLREQIFEPLDMHDTHFQLPKEKIERFTVGYSWNEETGLFVYEAQGENRFINEVTLFNGGGGLISTTLDYLQFCQLILNKGKVGEQRILKEETAGLMLENHLEEVRIYQDRFRLPLGEYGFGLGFSIRGNSENELEKVYGWGGAVGTYFKIDMENDLTYVMMIQLSPYRHLGLRQSIQDFMENSIIE